MDIKYGMKNDSLSLYLHIPFCTHRCSYCDFNTYVSVGDLRGAYARALAMEVEQAAGGKKRPLHTIFFGGGTPSLMSIEEMELILTAVNHNFVIAPNAEITMEINPDTVDAAYLGAYLQTMAELGINRLSFGAQSAIPSELALLERTHDFETVVRAVERSRAAGFNNISIDLIYGLPGQTLASWEKSLQTAVALNLEHLSLYCLTIEPATPMQRWLNDGRIALPDPDLAADQYELASDLMAANGFEQYEISNWALPNRQCVHNLTYWRNQPYLGLGAGAHGYAGGYRYHVVKQPRVYIRRLGQERENSLPFPLTTAVAHSHLVARDEQMSDTIITQLRLLQEGLDLTAFEETFGQPIDAAYDGKVSQLMEWGLLKEEKKRLFLTKHGRFLSNQVFYRLL